MSQVAVLDAIPAARETLDASPPAPVPSKPALASPPGQKAETPKKKPKAKLVAAILALLAIGGGGSLYALTMGHETTDDAQVEGHVQTVAARANGQVVEVLVKDNQVVEAGQTLVILDKADLDAKVKVAEADLAAADGALLSQKAQLALTEKNVDASLAQAKGGLNQAKGGLESSQASVAQARADVIAAESRQSLAKKDFARIKELFDSGALARAELDNRQSVLDQADANLESAKARVIVASAGISSNAGGMELAQGRLSGALSGPEQIDVARANVVAAEARKQQAQAALHIAELNLGYAEVKAPTRGIVSRRSVEVGQLVSPERALMAIVPLDDVWVVANFKETQLEQMKPGQPVEIEVDAYGGKKFKGHVDSFSGGTGSRFALLPADNASGNYVKVVQRVPTLIRLDDPSRVDLRPGMSVSVDVKTK